MERLCVSLRKTSAFLCVYIFFTAELRKEVAKHRTALTYLISLRFSVQNLRVSLRLHLFLPQSCNVFQGFDPAIKRAGPLSRFPAPFIIHSSLFTLHSSLFTFHSSLFTFHSSLFTFHFSLFTFHFSLFTLHSSLFTFHFSLFTYLQPPHPI